MERMMRKYYHNDGYVSMLSALRTVWMYRVVQKLWITQALNDVQKWPAERRSLVSLTLYKLMQAGKLKSLQHCSNPTGAFWRRLALQVINVSRPVETTDEVAPQKAMSVCEVRRPDWPLNWKSPPYPLVWECLDQESTQNNPKVRGGGYLSGTTASTVF